MIHIYIHIYMYACLNVCVSLSVFDNDLDAHDCFMGFWHTGHNLQSITLKPLPEVLVSRVY